MNEAHAQRFFQVLPSPRIIRPKPKRILVITDGLLNPALKMQNRPKIIVMSATAKRLLEPTLDEHSVGDLVDKVLEKPTDLNPERFINEVNVVLGR